ncbi:LLM class flavin-dependent oxidoreductase [Kitasatospora sp. NBC_00458]|uniref:LLM class flavin-dependent oxidoreductase n=1 Tax=Kitasatospora sp. NBC_00458 TaxID=2903568 RepID=UPI002E18C051
MAEEAPELRLFATVPPLTADRDGYLGTVRRTARLAEEAGFRGALVYSDNNTVDPWVVAQEVLTATEHFAPLVAVQPVYAHPYAVAKKIASYGVLHGRRIALNLVAGGVVGDLRALCDETPHDDRYLRLTEYAQLVVRLLSGTGPVTFEGRYYRARDLPMVPALPAGLAPELYMSGSSEAGSRAAGELGAVPVRYPLPSGPGTEGDLGALDGGGVRIGIIARDTDHEAWTAAHERFPASRAGRLAQMLARSVSDSEWVARLSASDEFPGGPDSPYWMGPFRTYATYCPYLVGSHEKVEAELARYLDAGCRTFITDTARADSDHAATAAAFAGALRRAGGPAAARVRP